MEEPIVNMLERRWFAVQSTTRSLQAECDLLQEAMHLAQASWQRANRQLAEFEALGEALEAQLAALDTPGQPRPQACEERRLEMSAA